jgi:exonuclease III
VSPAGGHGDLSREAVVEGHANGIGVPTERDARATDGEQWVVVSRRKRARLNDKDSRSIVIWGVLPSTPQQTVSKFVNKVSDSSTTLERKLVACGVERKESVAQVLTFPSMVARDAQLPSIQRVGARMGWKALKSRPFQTRQQQRATSKPIRSVDVLQGEEGYYGPLNVLDDSVACSSAHQQDDPNLVVHPNKGKQLETCSRLKVGSLNVQGGLANKIAELELYFIKRQFDIVALQEVRTVAKLQVKGYRYYANVCEGGQGGVGFLIALHLVPLITIANTNHDNQLWLKLRGTGGQKNLHFCSAYMPQESTTVEERRKAWAALQDNAHWFKQQGDVILAGDMNARLGLPKTTRESKALGPYAIGNTSPNGELLLDLMLALDLINLAGFYKPPTPAGWVTRTDPTRDVSSQIDYLLTPAGNQRGQAENFRVDYTNFDSDHHLLQACLSCPRKLPKSKKPCRVKRYCIEKLREKRLEGPEEERAHTPADNYQQELVNTFGETWDPAEIAEMVNLNQGGVGQVADDSACATVVQDFIGRMNQALESSVGSKVVHKKFSRPWFDADVRQAIQARREAFLEFKECHTQRRWDKYKRLRLTARRIVCQKKKEHWERMLRTIGEDSSRNPFRMWSAMKRIMGYKKSGTDMKAVRREDGTLAIGAVDKREALSAYVAKLGQPTKDPHFDPAFLEETELLVGEYAEQSLRLPAGDMDVDFTEEELIMAMDKLQYYKASSYDQVRNEALKEGGGVLRSNLLKLFNWINSTENVPVDWARSMCVMLYKDGDESDPGNYRGISLISCLGKLYLSLWAQRITDNLESKLAEEQGGFRSHRSTVDQIFVFNEALLRRRRAGDTTFCFFIDFRKAFDTVWHDGLWRRLWEMGVRGKAWRILRGLYSRLKSSVLVEGEPSNDAPLLQGVRQGCPLSPILFSCFVNNLVDRLKEKGFGVEIGNRELCSLLYADDIVLLANSAEELQAMIEVVDNYCREWRLSVNLGKSKVMIVAPNGVAAKDSRQAVEPPEFTFRGVPLEIVDRYKYLGVTMTNKLLWDQHISQIVDKGKKALQGIRRLLSQRLLPMKIKRLALTAVVRAKLEYASQIWYCNSAQTDAIESIQHQGCVRILRTNAKSSRVALRTVLGLPSLQARRDMLKLFYYGVLLSKGIETWPRYSFEVIPSKVNKVKGRSQQHWLNRFQSLTKTEALKKARKTIAEDLAACDGQLRKYHSTDPSTIIDPVQRWRSSVRTAIASREAQHLREEAKSHSTLEILATATADSFLRLQNVLRRSPHPINWIRIRLLCGTSSLNGTMSKITRGTRASLCPMCGLRRETVVHFLRECLYSKCVVARTLHARVAPHIFDSLTPVQQSAFILGCKVEVAGKIAVASPEEDLANFELVRSLWELRCYALSTEGTRQSITLPDSKEIAEQDLIAEQEGGSYPLQEIVEQDLTDRNLYLYFPAARRNHLPRGGGGVVAHGSNATLSN